MDNVCHTLVGAALGEAGLKARTRFGAVTLMVSANLPDVDVLVFATNVPSVAFRRGWTHGTIAQLSLPLLLTASLYVLDRLRPARVGVAPARVGALLLLSYLGVLSHVGLDWLNNYGVRLLMPFDGRWFYGDTLFIIDPWLWLALGVGVWLARRVDTVWHARWALLAAGCYIIAMCAAAHVARGIVLDHWQAAGGVSPVGAMVGPVPVTPLRREVIIDAGDHYVTGEFSWFPLRVVFDPRQVPKGDQDPRVARAREAPAVRGFLVWSRFPYWTLEPIGGRARVTVRDMRMVGRGGLFTQSVDVE